MARTYVVKRDTLRKVANAQHGDGALFARIAALNGLRIPCHCAMDRLFQMPGRREQAPHASTANQFLDELQFNSCRPFGHEVATPPAAAMTNSIELPAALALESRTITTS